MSVPPVESETYNKCEQANHWVAQPLTVAQEFDVARSGGRPKEVRSMSGAPLSRDVLRHLMGVMHAMKDHVAGPWPRPSISRRPSSPRSATSTCRARSASSPNRCTSTPPTSPTSSTGSRHAGLVVRTVDPDDRRVRRIVRTPEGEALRRRALDEALATAPTVAPLSASGAAHALRPARQDRRSRSSSPSDGCLRPETDELVGGA